MKETPTPVAPYSGEQRRAVLDLADRLAAEIGPAAEAHDRAGTFPVESVRRTVETGYTLLTLPAELGGWGADYATALTAQRHLARGCAATSFTLQMHFVAVRYLAHRWRNGEARWQPLLESVRDDGTLIAFIVSPSEWSEEGRAITARPADDGGGWLVSGRRGFGSLSPVADYGLTFGFHEAGAERQVVAGLFRFDDPGVRILNDWDSLGLRATGSHDVVLDNVRIAPEHVIEVRPVAELLVPGSFLFVTRHLGMLAFAGTYLGIADAARQEAIATARTRRPGLSDRPLAEVPGVRQIFAELEMAHRPAALVWEGQIERWKDRLDFDEESHLTLAIARLFIVHSLVRAVDLALTAIGGAGFHRRSPLERHYRDVRAGPVQPLNQVATYDLIARRLLDEPAAPLR